MRRRRSVCSSTGADAERVKCEQGVFGPAGETPPQVARVLERLAREIVHTLGAVEQVIGGAPVDELTLFGGTALLGGLDGFLSQQTGIPAARLGMPRPDRGGSLVAGGPPILFAQAIALALRGTTQSKTRMNFRQDEFALKLNVGRVFEAFRTTAWLAAATLLIVLLSFVTTARIEDGRADALEGQARQIYADLVPGEAPPGDLVGALRQQVDSANERAEFLGVYRGNLSALDLLGELSRIVPESLEIGLEEMSIDRQTIRMRVNADSFQAADRLGAEIATFEPFAGARIGSIETDAKSGAKRFSVTINLKPPGELE
jgi:hypothetical protein